MLIAGFQKLTLLDYPDHVAALIFTQGCNFACGYCHNPEMIPFLRILPAREELEPEWILKFLKTRIGLLDSVVITGGEPTLQEDLLSFLRSIKKMGFLIKLDTNGSHPQVLRSVIDKKLVDYIAMDVKASVSKYADVVKNKNTENILRSITIIMKSHVDYEFRSTILPALHSEEDIKDMGEMVRGAKRWYLQNFRPFKTLQKSFSKESAFSEQKLQNYQKIAMDYVPSAGIRF